VWVQPWKWIASSPGAQATLHYQLMSAVLQPGAQSFGQIEAIGNVGDGSAAYPSLAMAADGSAYVAYGVLSTPLAPGSMSSDEIHVARFNGQSWSSVGVVNRLLGQVAARTPSASNAPVVAVDDRGQALVVWQEPEIEGVARIWARRIFGATKGNVLAVSPSSIGGSQVTTDAEAPALALNEYGQAEVAFRLAGGPGSPLGAPHVLVNTLTTPRAEEVSSFTGSLAVGGAATVGPPSVAVNGSGEYRLSYTAAGATLVAGGAEAAPGATTTVSAPTVLGPASAEPALQALAPNGNGVTAWQSVGPAGLPVVEVREGFSGGASQIGYLSAPVSGPLSDLVGAQSELGDTLIAFRQGSAADSQVMASLVRPPPEAFLANVPGRWVKASAAVVSWEAAPEAIGKVSYAVVVDGHVVADGLSGLSYRLDARELGDGTRRIQVLAADDLGQQTLSHPVTLHVESNPPQVAVKRLGHDRVQVRVYDDPAGVNTKDTLIVFGDGATVAKRNTVVHAYRRPGRYTIVVHATDAVGNTRDAHVLVAIP
jgi:PKD domain